MKKEKSCGAVIFRNVNGIRQYFLILNKKNNAKGHWGFPKGHVEGEENEFETAAREVFEETGLKIVFFGSERVVSQYNPRPGIEKDAVYFLATVRNNQTVKLQKEEVGNYKWCTFSEAKQLLTFDSKILQKFEKTFEDNIGNNIDNNASLVYNYNITKQERTIYHG